MIIAQERLINSKKQKHLGKRFSNPSARMFKMTQRCKYKGPVYKLNDTAQSFFAVTAIYSLNIVVLPLSPIFSV